jgi:eukaryotic-like serine/threonine-protein kinase
VFQANRSGTSDLVVKRSDGAGQEERLLTTGELLGPMDWSPDGRRLLYRSGLVTQQLETRGLNRRLWVLPLEGDRTPTPIVSHVLNAKFSPDGRWIAYDSNETGVWEVYVQPFPGPGGRVKISSAGGAQAQWRRDGRELFYLGLDDRLMAVPLEFSGDGADIGPGVPAALFVTRVGGAVQGGGFGEQYVPSDDGTRFLLSTVADDEATQGAPITVVVNAKLQP